MKFILTLFSLIISIGLFAQIGIGPIEIVRKKSGVFKSEDIERLKSTTTLLVCSDDADPDRIYEELSKVWTITPLEVMKHSEFIEKNQKGYSILSMRSFWPMIRKYGSHYPVESTNYKQAQFYLQLSLDYKDKKGKIKRNSYTRIELFHTFEDYAVSAQSKNKNVEFDYLYNSAEIKNWNLGFLKVYLKIVNDQLELENELWQYNSGYDNRIKQLKNKTLYIPEYTLDYLKTSKGAANNGNTDDNTIGEVNWLKLPTENVNKTKTSEKVLEGYPFKHKVIKTEELSELILNSEESIYYLVYVKSSTDQYVTIYQTKPERMIYSKYTPMSKELNKKDIEAIVRKIR